MGKMTVRTRKPKKLREWVNYSSHKDLKKHLLYTVPEIAEATLLPQSSLYAALKYSEVVLDKHLERREKDYAWPQFENEAHKRSSVFLSKPII
jgi:hypothetical protein